MSIKKQYQKKGNMCKVTFSLPKEAVKSAKSVHLVGEFNNWSISTTPMEKQKNRTFAISLNLEKGREYQFGYLIDGTIWENDWEAEKYVPNPFGNGDNSVVVV